MGFNKNKVDYSGNYQTLYVLNYLPVGASIIFEILLIVSYNVLLVNQSIEMDSLHPIMEAGRIDNFLIWIFSNLALCLLIYITFVVLTKRYYLSQTKASKAVDLFEKAKTRMGIDFKLEFRTNEQPGIVLTSHRSVFFATIDISQEAENRILKEKEIGEVLLAFELSKIKYLRPIIVIIGLLFLTGVLASFLSITIALYESYGYLGILIQVSFPILIPCAIIFLFTGLTTRPNVENLVESEYKISPKLAQMSLLEGYPIQRSTIFKHFDEDTISQ